MELPTTLTTPSTLAPFFFASLRAASVSKFANRYLAARDIFFIGRGIDHAISMEGSLNLKEISYIHSEAYAAGELKHGTMDWLITITMVFSSSIGFL